MNENDHPNEQSNEIDYINNNIYSKKILYNAFIKQVKNNKPSKGSLNPLI